MAPGNPAQACHLGLFWIRTPVTARNVYMHNRPWHQPSLWQSTCFISSYVFRWSFIIIQHDIVLRTLQGRAQLAHRKTWRTATDKVCSCRHFRTGAFDRFRSVFPNFRPSSSSPTRFESSLMYGSNLRDRQTAEGRLCFGRRQLQICLFQ